MVYKSHPLTASQNGAVGLTSGLMALVMSVSSAVPALAQIQGQAQQYPVDPLDSPMWSYHAKRIFGDDPVRFDARVKTIFPEIAENQRAFPVAVDARGIAGVKRMILFADLNPIPIAVDYKPVAAESYFATRIKLDQRTPVRGAVQIDSGEWLVSGGWIDAAGGGCSAPPVSRVKGDWADHLGEIRASAWPSASSGQGAGAFDPQIARVRLNFRHPMDTGLVENISIYHIDNVTLRGADKEILGEAHVEASVSEDPSFTFMPRTDGGEKLSVEARDTNGRIYTGQVAVNNQLALASPSKVAAQ